MTIVVTCLFPNMARSLELQHQLVKRLRKVVKAWPVDPTRKGRDLGEFLKENYVQQFKKEYLSNVCMLCCDFPASLVPKLHLGLGTRLISCMHVKLCGGGILVSFPDPP